MSILKKIILLLTLASLLPFIIVSYLNYTRAVEVMRTEIIDDLSLYVEIKAMHIHEYFDTLKRDVSLLSKNPLIIDEFQKLLHTYKENSSKSQDFKTVSNACNETIDPYFSAYDLYNLFLITLDGDIIFSVRKESDYMTNLIDGTYKKSELAKSFKEALKFTSLNISDFRYYEGSQKPASFISEPLFDNGVIIGVLAIQISADKMYDIVQNYSGLGSTGETIIASRIDNKALFLNPLRYNKDRAFKYSVDIGSKDGVPIQEAVQGKSGSGIYTDYQGNEVLAAWQYLPFLRMGMVVKQDTQEAFFDIEQLKNWALLIGFFSLLVMVYVVYYIAKLVQNIDNKKEQYEFAINGSNDGLWDWNLITNEVYLSPKWKSMLGFNDDELPNEFTSWEKTVHPDDLQVTLDEIMQTHIKPGISYKGYYRLRHKDGSWVWILSRGQTIFDKQGMIWLHLLGHRNGKISE